MYTAPTIPRVLLTFSSPLTMPRMGLLLEFYVDTLRFCSKVEEWDEIGRGGFVEEKEPRCPEVVFEAQLMSLSHCYTKTTTTTAIVCILPTTINSITTRAINNKDGGGSIFIISCNNSTNTIHIYI